MSDVQISVVIPIFNESVNLPELIDRCLAALRDMDEAFELILVDDGSQDGSVDLIEEAARAHPEIVGLFLNRNYGQHAAIMAGFSCLHGQVVVTLDGDLQNPPEEIPRLVAKVQAGFDVVGTVRTPREDSFFRRLASSLVNRAIRKATGIAMHDYGCMLRAYGRDVVEAMLACSEKTTFIPVLANSFARRAAELEVNHQRRGNGVSKYSLFKLIALQFDLLTSMTTFPIRVLCLLGGAMATTGVGLGLCLLLARLIFGAAWAADGVFTLFAVLFVFLGGQFFGLGLLGEYIGRIFIQVRGRPAYFIHHATGDEFQRERQPEEVALSTGN